MVSGPSFPATELFGGGERAKAGSREGREDARGKKIERGGESNTHIVVDGINDTSAFAISTHTPLSRSPSLSPYLPTSLPPYLPTSLPPYLPTSLPPYLPTSLPYYLPISHLPTSLPPYLPTSPYPYLPTSLPPYIPLSYSISLSPTPYLSYSFSLILPRRCRRYHHLHRGVQHSITVEI